MAMYLENRLRKQTSKPWRVYGCLTHDYINIYTTLHRKS